jgi:amino acid adenylation domain-containing protein
VVATLDTRPNSPSPAPSAAEDEVFVLPASPAQARMWFLDRLSGGGAAYSVPAAVRLRGALDAAAWAAAFDGIVRRHEVLRAAFPTIDGEPVQVVRPARPVTWPLVDLSGLPAEARERQAERILASEAGRPFDLARGPVFRTLLLRLAPDEHVALCTLHHIAADGWSLGVLLRELAAGYAAALAGQGTDLPEPPLQYPDFAAWQRRWLDGPEAARQRAYWTETLAGAPVLDLPADRPRPAEPSFAGGRVGFRVPAAVARAVRELGAARGATPMMTLLAAFKVLLSRYTGQADVVVGTPVAGRNRRELEEVIGLFVNTLALRTDLGGDPSFAEAVSRVRRTVVGAQAHQDLPFDRVAAALRADADPRRNPLFETEFVYVAARRDTVRLPGLTLQAAGAHAGATRFDLELHLIEGDDLEAGLWGELVYREALFHAATMERMAAHFTRLLEAAVAAPDAPVSTLCLLGMAERHTVVEAWNRTRGPYSAELCIHQLFERQARRTPDAVAVDFGDARMTFAELDARANEIAHHLRRLGVGPEVRVGLCLERGMEMMPAILGVLKAGGAYVPVDPGHPVERITYVLQDARVSVMLLQERLRGRFPVDAGVRMVCVDRTWPVVRADGAAPPASGVTSENLCYVIYTSGSTGRPKGVAMHHRGVVNYIEWGMGFYGADAGSGAPVFSSMAVDLTITNLLPLFCGHPVRFLPEENPVEALADVLRTRPEFGMIKITPVHLSLLTPLLTAEEARRAARTLVIGADFLPAEPTVWWQENVPEVRLMNEYGPTETVVGCSAYVLPNGVHRHGPVPVGGPIRNLTFYVLDGRMQPVPIGLPGELYIGGAGVARGYLGRPGLSAEKFVPDPFAGPGARMYRTGDRARWQADGNLLILGRTDNQVKVRGYRVELGEIEATLRRHPSVTGCVVVLREDRPGDRRLVAYVVSDADDTALREHLRRTLPEYMVPAAFVRLASLPKTATGKIDPRTLPAPAYAADGEGHVAPRTELERALAGIWADVLGVERVGVEDGFFELGGDSLLVMRIGARLRASLGRDVPLPVLLTRTTVAALAEWMETQAGAAPAHAPIPRADRARPLPLSFPQARLWFLDRAQDTGASTTIPIGLRITGAGLDADALERAFGAVVERHEVLRTVFPALEGEGRQVVLDPAPFALPRADLRGRADADAEVARLGAELAEAPYDLARGPLFRVVLARTGEDAHVLLMNLHHVVFDGWSSGVLVRELTAAYAALRAGGTPDLPALPIQYADYAAWQRDWLRGDEGQAQLAYWTRRLAGLPALELPGGRERPESPGYHGAALSVQLGAERSAALRAAARARRTTLYTVLLAAFKVVLAHHGRARDLVVGTDVAGRGRMELEPLIGFFINELVLRTDLSGDPTLDEVVDRVRDTTLEAFRHQELPFAVLVRELAGERTLGATPLFGVMFGLDNTPVEPVRVDGLGVEPIDTSSPVSPWELSLYLNDLPDGIAGAFRYRTELFDPAVVEDLRADWLAVLDAFCADPSCRLEALVERLADAGRERWEARARAAQDAARQRLGRVRRQGIALAAE